jgi:hypothetical protein
MEPVRFFDDQHRFEVSAECLSVLISSPDDGVLHSTFQKSLLHILHKLIRIGKQITWIGDD